MKKIILLPFYLLLILCAPIIIYLLRSQAGLFVLKSWYLFKELHKRKVLKKFLISKILGVLKISDRMKELEIFKQFKFRNLEKYKIGEKDSKIKLFVPLEVTSSGKMQRECPNKECSPKIFYIDKQKSLNKSLSVISTNSEKQISPITYCPYCGIKEINKGFISQKDKQYILQTVVWAFYEDMRDILFKLFKDSKHSVKIVKMFTPEYIYKNLDNQIKNKGPIQSTLIKFVKAFYTIMHEKDIKPKNRHLTFSRKFLLYFERSKKTEEILPDLKFKITVKNSVESLLESEKYKFNPLDINPEVTIGTFDDIIINKEPIGSFSLSIPVKPYNSKIHREDLLRNIKCPFCSQGYGVYAIAFFCPNCGNHNLTAHFQKEKDMIKNQMEKVYDIKNKDREFYYRLLGNAHEDTLTLFETYLKNLFSFVAKRKNITQKKLKTNTFQNLERIEGYYKKISINPFTSITVNEKKKLSHYIKIRHVVGHNLSMVDKKFISDFPDYLEGTNVSISENGILEFISICEKIIVFLEKEVKAISSDNKKSTFSKGSSFKSQKEELSDSLFELLKFSHAIKKSWPEQGQNKQPTS